MIEVYKEEINRLNFFVAQLRAENNQLAEALVICVDEIEEFGDRDERDLVCSAAKLAREIIAAKGGE